MRHYYVTSFAQWFVVQAATKRRAKSVGVEEWGRGAVHKVRIATQDEIENYIANKGKVAMKD